MTAIDKRRTNCRGKYMVFSVIKVSIAALTISVGSWLSFSQISEAADATNRDNAELKVQVTQLEERIRRLEERFGKLVKPERRQTPLT
ncbi:hypothetical protein V8G57_17040 [Collimonas sp. H4R21]|uniref:Uncharacterized protein n=1 Tax=Collimonas rhizosphaerae TaxID=3126357 RepID=A0ABU9PYN3_9BURK